MKGVSESLAGRIGIIDMLPLAISEKRNLNTDSFNPENLSKPFEFKVNTCFEEIYK